MARRDVSDELVVKAVGRYAAVRPFGDLPDRLLMEWTGQPAKVVERAMERALNHGLIEFGVSLRTAWLTPLGKQLQADSSISST